MNPSVRTRESDLSTRARIRNAALEGFATRGVEATSVRDVAQRAGVSAGLVQHHFSTKAGLRDAVNEYVIASVNGTFKEFVPESSGPITLEELGNRVTRTVAENSTAFLYVGRSLADGDEAAYMLFDALVDIALSQFEALAEQQLLRSDVDLEWAAMHTVIFNLGTVLFEAALSRRLGDSLFESEELSRWNTAATALVEHGVLRPPSVPD